MKKQIIRRLTFIAGISLFVCFGIILICNVTVVINAQGRTFDRISQIPAREIGLLLGTSPITPQGGHNYYFDNRIKATAELYHAGKIKKILVSGGDYTATEKHGCDEPTAMRDSLVAYGVPDTCIIEHWKGWRTLNSIKAVKDLYDFDNITIISQKYHNERALYQADHIRINAIGYNAEPSPIRRNRIKNTIREYFARVKLFIDLL
ncbi:MAG: vancomycin high temperature exclusion protein [Prevotella sp.]